MIYNNLLIKADNIEGLKYLIEKKGLAGKVDLVYIDPPYSTGNNFHISETRANSISCSSSSRLAYSDKLSGEGFLDFIKERLVLLKELLSENGSIYLHIDYKIGHYIKVLMDEVFGRQNFINDIARIKCNPKNFKRTGYGNVKDMILFYSKGKKPIWNEPKTRYTEKELKKLYPKIDSSGRRYTTVPIHAPGETKNGESSRMFRGKKPPAGRHWRTNVKTLEQWDEAGMIEWSSTGNPRKKIYADEQEGKRVQDIWEMKDIQNPAYPTEKNQSILDLIISTSSDVDSIVLDCFCGSGTTMKSAAELGRRWIGIDSSEHAIEVCRSKLSEIDMGSFFVNAEYEYIDMKKGETADVLQVDSNTI